ncbi:TetR/AcrR family transcriptional regulator [Streptomyces specialis]|uniref:TetR/AcrR family transcriptional regulator n=1 Tax=Streptomyces specialis TaxID=498367 RepID=UPI00073ECE7E|nr:TetR/AcrR family transcriptional regulator [Streptomyces specialis]
MPRPPKLTAEDITRTALRLGDREGAEAMTMRRIAAELDCDPMSLYRHYTNREALLDAVADAALAAVGEPDADEPWAERLTGLLTAVRDAALRHPGVTAHIAARPPLGPQGRRIAAALIGTLADTGLPPADVVRTTQTLIAYLAASLAMSVHAGTRDARWEQVRTVFDELPGGMPGQELNIVGSTDQFGYGLRLLIDGIRARSAGPRV